jgi:hypothetical protein
MLTCHVVSLDRRARNSQAHPVIPSRTSMGTMATRVSCLDRVKKHGFQPELRLSAPQTCKRTCSTRVPVKPAARACKSPGSIAAGQRCANSRVPAAHTLYIVARERVGPRLDAKIGSQILHSKCHVTL